MNFPAFKKLALAVIASSALIVVSCQKDKVEDPEPEPTKKELLSNTWKVTDLQTSDGTSIINLAPQTQCLKDNTVTLKADDTFILDEGADVCDTPLEGTGTWSLVENETKIKLEVDGGDPMTATINDVNTTTLKISYYFEDAPIPGTYVVVLQKQ